ncbi:MAG: hypothetical protein HGA27_07085, partial [Peptococcaceae bacterium]|nr:hypothetical protein [Peptococcaceae bacterium]
MSIIIGIVNVLGPVAMVLFVLGVGYRVIRYIYLLRIIKRPMGRATLALDDVSSSQSMGAAYKKVITGPVRKFSSKANRMWSFGYISYHLGIITILAGYSVSIFILAVRILQGSTVPDVAANMAVSANYSVANLLAVVFGNAEPLQAVYLFGSYANAFISFSWIAVVAALVGNSMLLINHLLRRSGAVTRAMDQASRNIRTKGFHNNTNLFIALLVSFIVWSEVLARLHLGEWIVFVHSLLGLTLLAVFPFTVLNHMIYAWLGVFYAARMLNYWGISGALVHTQKQAAHEYCPTCATPLRGNRFLSKKHKG